MSRYLANSRNAISGNVLEKIVYKVLSPSGQFTLVNPDTLASLIGVNKNNLNGHLAIMNANNVFKKPQTHVILNNGNRFYTKSVIRNPFYGGNLKRGNIRKTHLYGGTVSRAVEKFKGLMNKKQASNAMKRAAESAVKRANRLRNQEHRRILEGIPSPNWASRRIRNAMQGTSPLRSRRLFD